MAKSSPASNTKKTASPHRPQFFKVFLPEHSSDHLKIPLAFVHHIGGGGGGGGSVNTVSLKGPGGGVWYTDLVTNSGELFFGKGWKEFISDHSVQFGDFLVFEYAGNMRFNVLVFDHSACEKEASLLARPSGDTFSLKRKRGRQPGKKFNEKQSPKDSSLLKTTTPRSILRKKLDKSVEANASVLQARELSMCSTMLEVEKMPPGGEDFARDLIHSMAAAKDNSLLKTTTPRSILGKKLDESIETNASVLQARELSMCSTTLEVEKIPPSGEAAKDNSLLKTTTPRSILGKKLDKSIETNASVLQARELSMCSTTPEVEKMPSSGEAAKDNSLLKTTTPRSILGKKLDKSIETNASVLQGRELSMCSTTLEVEKMLPSGEAAKDNSLLKTTTTRFILGKKLDESIETNASVLQARELLMCSTTLEVEKMPPSGEAAKDNSLLKTTTPRSILGKKLDKSVETNASVLQARELSMCSTMLEVEKMPPSGEVLFSGKRQNGLISQRRPVTLEEVRGVLQKAKAFKSEHPFGIIQMRDSYVYFSFALNIPITFAREHLPWPRGNVILWDPSGRRWEVKSIPHGKTRCFSAGWRNFSIANNLETGDCCVFEVIQKYEMKVHILRVVEELTPLISPSIARIMQPLLEG